MAAFFLPARNRGLLRGGRMSEATDRPDRAKTADFEADFTVWFLIFFSISC